MANGERITWNKVAFDCAEYILMKASVLSESKLENLRSQRDKLQQIVNLLNGFLNISQIETVMALLEEHAELRSPEMTDSVTDIEALVTALQSKRRKRRSFRRSLRTELRAEISWFTTLTEGQVATLRQQIREQVNIRRREKWQTEELKELIINEMNNCPRARRRITVSKIEDVTCMALFKEFISVVPVGVWGSVADAKKMHSIRRMATFYGVEDQIEEQ